MNRDDDGLTPNCAMRVKQWHWGKLLMLWVVAPIVSPGVLIAVYSATDAGDFFNVDLLLGFFLFLLAVSIIVMLVITWIWLTGKESR